jgi:hypothetical protein
MAARVNNEWLVCDLQGKGGCCDLRDKKQGVPFGPMKAKRVCGKRRCRKLHKLEPKEGESPFVLSTSTPVFSSDFDVSVSINLR